MIEIRIHGRGGQGVVTAADLLAISAFTEQHYAQAFPSFGSERTGAPVVSYCRISESPIRTREPVLAPDVLIVQDPTLLTAIDVFSGLKNNGYVVINSSKELNELAIPVHLLAQDGNRLIGVPASEIARKNLGRPLPNAALLGAVAALTGILRLESVTDAIKERFKGRVGDGNAAAATEAFDYVVSVKEPIDA